MQKEAVRRVKDDYYHLEDIAMTAASQFLGDELLKWIGVKKKPVRPAPTAQVHLEARKLYEDFNYEMEDGSWYHFEFESDRITPEDLRRFREYEAATSRAYGVEVVTCVICSAKMKKVRDSLKEGINTYHVKVIRIKDQNADKLFREIKKAKKLKRKDLIPILLSPFMSGEMSIKDRVLQGLTLIQKEETVLSKEETSKMEAVLYAFANKLLGADELNEVKEMLAMTKLGQMLMEEGMQRGIQKGSAEQSAKYNRLIIKLVAEGKSQLLAEAAENPELLEKLFKEYQC